VKKRPSPSRARTNDPRTNTTDRTPRCIIILILIVHRTHHRALETPRRRVEETRTDGHSTVTRASAPTNHSAGNFKNISHLFPPKKPPPGVIDREGSSRVMTRRESDRIARSVKTRARDDGDGINLHRASTSRRPTRRRFCRVRTRARAHTVFVRASRETRARPKSFGDR